MPSLRRQFIEDNRNVFETYLEKASDERRPVLGLGVLTATQSLKAILVDMDDSYLPLTFIHLFYEFESPKDREFVLTGLKSLSEVNDGDKLADPTIVYIYAYCLLHHGDKEKHYGLLERLSEQCFMPALVTTGDACIANHSIKEGLLLYKHAMDHGYTVKTSHYNKLISKDASFFKNIPFLFHSKFDLICRRLEFLHQGFRGEHALYLDFYGIKQYLNEYWDIPKVERIKKLSEQS